MSRREFPGSLGTHNRADDITRIMRRMNHVKTHFQIPFARIAGAVGVMALVLIAGCGSHESDSAGSDEIGRAHV